MNYYKYSMGLLFLSITIGFVFHVKAREFHLHGFERMELLESLDRLKDSKSLSDNQFIQKEHYISTFVQNIEKNSNRSQVLESVQSGIIPVNSSVPNGETLYSFFVVRNDWDDVLEAMIKKELNLNAIIKYWTWYGNGVPSFLSQGVNQPLIFIALYYGSYKCLKLLLKYKINVNTFISGIESYPAMPLIDVLVKVGGGWPNAGQSANVLLQNGAISAVKGGNQGLFKIALQNKSDGIIAAFIQNYKAQTINLIQKINNIPLLLYACQNNLSQTAAALIAAKVNVNIADSTGMTPLMYAVQNNMVSVVAQLITAGAQVNAVNKQNQMALDIAIQNNNAQNMIALYQAGAYLNDTRLNNMLNNSTVASYLAGQNGLIAMGANLLTAVQNNNTAAALQYTKQLSGISLSGQFSVVNTATWTKSSVLDYLGQLQNGTYVMPSATPLMIAVLLNNPTLVTGLLTAGANPTVVVSINQRSVSPLTIATLLGYTVLIQPFFAKNPIQLLSSSTAKKYDAVGMFNEVSGLSSSERQQDIPQVSQNQPATKVNQNPDWVAINTLFGAAVIQQ